MLRHKTAIIVGIFLLVIVIISGLNLFFLLENLNTRESRVKDSVERVLKSVEEKPVPTVHAPIKGVDYFDGKDGMSIKGDRGEAGADGIDGQSIKGDTGATGVPGRNGNDGLTLEIRCNAKKNRWEIKYVGDLSWKLMNNEVVKCTIEEETNDGNE